MNNQKAVSNASKIAFKPATRGNFWEITYREDTPPFEAWLLEKTADLANDLGKTKVEVTADPQID